MNEYKWMPLPTPLARQRYSVCSQKLPALKAFVHPLIRSTPHWHGTGGIASLCTHTENWLQFKTLPLGSSRRQGAGSNYQVKLSYLLRQSVFSESAQSLLGLYLVLRLGGPDIPSS